MTQPITTAAMTGPTPKIPVVVVPEARTDLLGDAAWDELAEHGVEPAGDLRSRAVQVTVTLGPYLQHCCVIVGGDLPPGGRAQRRDRN